MSELKTLKDMLAEPQLSYISKEALKQEAIKWVKHYDCVFSTDDHPIFFIKEFFNLTDEDLKP